LDIQIRIKCSWSIFLRRAPLFIPSM
jgi:hypothetical protein